MNSFDEIYQNILWTPSRASSPIHVAVLSLGCLKSRLHAELYYGTISCASTNTSHTIGPIQTMFTCSMLAQYTRHNEIGHWQEINNLNKQPHGTWELARISSSAFLSLGVTEQAKGHGRL